MKSIFTSLLMVLFASGLTAQPVITSAFNPTPGDEWKLHPINAAITSGQAGANVTWDFSSVQVIWNPEVGNYLSPASTPFAIDFPDATVAYEAKIEVGTFHYFKASGTKLERLGEASVLRTLIYPTPPTVYTYPFTYNTTVSQNYACTTMVGSLELTRTATWEATGDAYGTLILPTGTHSNVLRIRTENKVTDNYSGGVGEQKTDVIEYMWVDPNVKVPLMVISTKIYHTTGDTITTAKISDAVSSIADASNAPVKLHLQPNPVVDQATVTLDMEHEGSILAEVYSSDGRLITAFDPIHLPAGYHRQTFDMHALKPGCYLLRITTSETTKALRFVKL
jgi:hypothetical protein